MFLGAALWLMGTLRSLPRVDREIPKLLCVPESFIACVSQDGLSCAGDFPNVCPPGNLRAVGIKETFPHPAASFSQASSLRLATWASHHVSDTHRRSVIPYTMRRTLPRWRYMWAADRRYRAEFCENGTVTIRSGAEPGKAGDRFQDRGQADDMQQPQRSFARGTDSRSAMGRGSSTAKQRSYAFHGQYPCLILQQASENVYSRPWWS